MKCFVGARHFLTKLHEQNKRRYLQHKLSWQVENNTKGKTTSYIEDVRRWARESNDNIHGAISPHLPNPTHANRHYAYSAASSHYPYPSVNRVSIGYSISALTTKYKRKDTYSIGSPYKHKWFTWWLNNIKHDINYREVADYDCILHQQ